MKGDRSPTSIDARWAHFERLIDDLLEGEVATGTLKARLEARLERDRDELHADDRDRLDRLVDDAVSTMHREYARSGTSRKHDATRLAALLTHAALGVLGHRGHDHELAGYLENAGA